MGVFGAHMTTSFLTSAGSDASAANPSEGRHLRSPAMGHVAEILDVEDPLWAMILQHFHLSSPNGGLDPHVAQGY
jgi:hypothetical protein